MSRKPNTQECDYKGRRMSCLRTDIEASKGYVLVGSRNDDDIYFNEKLGDNQEFIKERVKIKFFYEPEDEDGFYCEIDLEDILKFSAKHCGGIYKRILDELGVQDVKKEK